MAAFDEIIVRGTTEAFVATRVATPLREIPQTISLVSPEQIRQQDSTDLSDALVHAIGITTVRDDTLGQTFYARGFRITAFHIDGGAAVNSFGLTSAPFLGAPDMVEFERIEILRGADSLFGGDGTPSASVNLVRKRPLDTLSMRFNASGGSWNDYRMEGDITGPVGTSTTLRARLAGVYMQRDSFLDTTRLTREKIFGALDYDLTPATLVSIGASIQTDNSVPFIGGLPLYGDGSDPGLPRNTAFTFNWGRYDTRIRELYLKIAQSFGPDWKLAFNATSLDGRASFRYGFFQSNINPVTHGLADPPVALFSASPSTQQQSLLDATLTGVFGWRGIRFEAAIGGDYRYLKDRASTAFFSIGPPLVLDAFRFDSTAYAEPVPPAEATISDVWQTTNQFGVYTSLRTLFASDWSVVTGARYSRAKAQTIAVFRAGTNSLTDLSGYQDPRTVAPYAGVMYELTHRYSLYVSYADINQTMGQVKRINGELLGPADGVNLELGIKGAWRNGLLNGSLAAYQIHQQGVPLRDARSPTSGAFIEGCCYLPGTNRSQGFDLEISGSPAPGWALNAGYTFNTNRAAIGNKLSFVTPKHLLKVWTSQELRGPLDGWTVGGSLRAQTHNTTGAQRCSSFDSAGECDGTTQNFRIEQKAYAVLDLRAAYRLNTNLQASLGVGNVFDRTYYETTGTIVSGNWYGEPRSVSVRIDGRY
ncbi:MAG: TonB-dependent receptor [Gammaproteobacteria bacterium]